MRTKHQSPSAMSPDSLPQQSRRPASITQGSSCKLGGLENELRSGVRGSDEVEAGAEQASEGLTDFRGVGAKQRTVRSGRRPGPAGASDSQNIGAASGPYTRSGAEGDEGDGLLVLNPDPVSQRKYEASDSNGDLR